MSQSIIFLVGRVGRNPEVRTFQSGKEEVNVSIGVSRRGTAGKTDWFDLYFYGKTGESAADKIRKGDLISVKGNLTIDQWVDRNSGQKRTKPKVSVRDFSLIESKNSTFRDMSEDFLVSKKVRDDPPVFQ